MINQLLSTKTTFEELVNELKTHKISVKQHEDLAILYYNTDTKLLDPLEQSCRSVIIEKDTLKIIGSQFNKIIQNTDAITKLKTVDWTKVVVEKSYEGTLLLVFWHKDKWYVTTRRCINAVDSVWVKNRSYRDLFDEAITNKFTLDELNKNYCYHFVLVHHNNRNIVNYNFLLGREYKEVFHVMTTEKYTLNEVEHKINDSVRNAEKVTFDSLDKLLEQLQQINANDINNHRITEEGFVLRVYDGKQFTVYKLQTEVYQYLMKLKPNNSNVHQGYLELYQKDKLADYLPYFTKYNNDIVKRINATMKTLSKELLDLYHCTRQKKSPEVYNILSDTYKKILYELHGLYINNRKQDFQENSNNNQESKSINVHDVYYFLKQMSAMDLRNLLLDRMMLLEKDEATFINKNCIYTTTQTMLMFKK
jgi:hypothetical protein